MASIRREVNVSVAAGTAWMDFRLMVASAIEAMIPPR